MRISLCHELYSPYSNLAQSKTYLYALASILGVWGQEGNQRTNIYRVFFFFLSLSFPSLLYFSWNRRQSVASLIILTHHTAIFTDLKSEPPNGITPSNRIIKGCTTKKTKKTRLVLSSLCVRNNGNSYLLSLQGWLNRGLKMTMRLHGTQFI